MAEAIGMGWQEHDAYDDWDAIANALYVSFVARPIAWASSGSPLSLAPYDLAVDDLSGNSVIVVQTAGGGSDDTEFVFRRLVTTSAPFDTVEVMHADSAGMSKPDSIRRIAIDRCEFKARLRFRDGSVATIADVRNEL